MNKVIKLNLLDLFIIQVSIDITKAFNNVLTQHTQITDSNGYQTLTKHYCDLYIDKILKNIDRTHVIYSPSQKSFLVVGKDQPADQPSPETYVSYTGIFLFAAYNYFCFIILLFF